MNVLVTGGAGFIGSHLCERLLKDGHFVINIDSLNDFYSPEIKKNNMAAVITNCNYKFYQTDLRDREEVLNIFKENSIDVVMHLAAYAGVRPSIKDPKLYTDVNITGTINLLDACRETGVKRFVFASSSSVYGNNKKVPFAEDDIVDFPISPYAATKKSCELICHTYYHLFKMNIVALRFFTVYGPRQRPDLAIHKFTNKILHNEPIQVYGDGSTERDYTYIDDILDGIIKAINYTENNDVYEIFNLGESQTISLKKMISTIENTLGIKAKKEYLPMQPGDVNRTFADISKSKRILNYNPQTSFEEGIKKFVQWFREEKGL